MPFFRVSKEVFFYDIYVDQSTQSLKRQKSLGFMHKSYNSNAKLAGLFWEIRGVYAKITPCAPMRRRSHMIPFRD